eukprot:CAMPEP_0194173532 /NCGR_PEP_ID=MMETSP0154-20130528/7838_1 /TAXON_ID=1049557 /ORGANISM="Thalassiothrix antarctica, Strain L6-D1" /LENGTH=409 /DNA_ID=CAMNT_0038886621 /DNA_START=67 /DNA_END=1293 /DNA_ORIENTATION=+
MSSSSSSSQAILFGITSFVAGGLAMRMMMSSKSSKNKEEDASSLLPATAQYRTKSPPISYPTYDYLNQPKESFIQICDMLINELLDDLTLNYKLPQRERDYLYKMLQYNVKGGKMNRGRMVVDAGVAILKENNSEIDNTTLCRLAVLGWSVEWLQAWLLIADDIMDSSVTRRGQPCWYKTLDDAWYIAINDAVTIESLVYKMIKRHFGYDPMLCYSILDLLTETTLQTELGQLCDTMCDVLTLQDLTPERWNYIVKYKTSFYSFYLSVALAMMFLGGKTQKEVYDVARDILIEMGIYFQAQDDYLDCYASPEVLGKIGTDIADKKCGWLFTKAYHELLEKDGDGKKLLDAQYGKCKVGTKEEQSIKELYTELGLPKLYEDYEKASYDKIRSFKESTKVATILSEAGIPW